MVVRVRSFSGTAANLALRAPRCHRGAAAGPAAQKRVRKRVAAEELRRRNAVRTAAKQLLAQQTEQLQTILRRLQDPGLREEDRAKLQELLATVKAKMKIKYKGVRQRVKASDGIEKYKVRSDVC